MFTVFCSLYMTSVKSKEVTSSKQGVQLGQTVIDCVLFEMFRN